MTVLWGESDRPQGRGSGALANLPGIHTFRVMRLRDLVRPGLFFVPAQRGGLQWTRDSYDRLRLGTGPS